MISVVLFCHFFVPRTSLNLKLTRSEKPTISCIRAKLESAQDYLQERVWYEPKVVFENDWLVAVDKPPGMSFHSEFEDGVLRTIRKLQSNGAMDYEGELHSVHRLDRITSGLLLFGKSREAASMLSQAFEEKTIQKFYVALTGAKPSKRMGTVAGDMVKSRRSQWKLARSLNNPAVTRFMSLPIEFPQTNGESVMNPKITNHFHLVLMRPLTGRTHQLRVAMRALSAPIYGDPLYHSSVADSVDRCYLHACALRICPPRSASKHSAAEEQPVQLVLPPRAGHLFESEAFRAAWQAFVLPAMGLGPAFASAGSDHKQQSAEVSQMLACLSPTEPVVLLS